MPDSNPTTLLLAVPGPEQYAAVPKAIVRNAIKQGQMRQSQLIWSPDHNDWMQVRDLPHLMQDTQQLQPAPELEPVPVPLQAQAAPLAQQTEKIPEPPKTQTLLAPTPPEPVISTTIKASGPLPKARASAVPTAQAKVKAGSAAARPVAKVSAQHVAEIDEHEDGFPIFKVLTIVLFFSIIGLIGSNYVLVDQPLNNSLAGTKYDQVSVHAHLVGFYQSGSIAIHIFSSPNLTDSNLLDFLTTLAQSTPRTALKGDLFETVGLTPRYFVKYAIRGQDWNQFSLMTHASDLDRKTFLLQNMTDSEGNFLLSRSPSMSDTAAASPPDKVNQAWKNLVNGLLHP